MADYLPPIGNSDNWWVRYGLGVAGTFSAAIFGGYSLAAQHSLIFGLGRSRGLTIEWVDGQQALLAGLGWLGLALSLFALGYARDDEKLDWLSKWLIAPGVFMMAIGFVGSAWYPMLRALS